MRISNSTIHLPVNEHQVVGGLRGLQGFKFLDQHPSAKPDPKHSGADTVEVAFTDGAAGSRLSSGPAVRGKVKIDNVNNTVTINEHIDKPYQSGDSSRVYEYVAGSGWRRRGAPNEKTEEVKEIKAGDTDILIWGDDRKFFVQIDSSSQNVPSNNGELKTETTIVEAKSGGGDEGTVSVRTEENWDGEIKYNAYKPKTNEHNDGFWSRRWSNLKFNLNPFNWG